MQGRSFKGLLVGSMDPGNLMEVGYCHYYDFPAFHMVKKHYGIRTKRYKLLHFYVDYDAWELYDLEEDPEEKHNAISDTRYAESIAAMHRKLDSIQKEYGVTAKESERAPREKIEPAYKDFKSLRGN